MVKPYLWLALTAFVAWIHSAKVVKALAATNKTETLTRTNNVMTIEDDEEKMLKGTLEKISDMSLALSPRSNQLKRMKSKLLRQVPKDTIGLTLKDPHLEDLMHSYSSEASDRSGLIRLLTERYGDGTMAEALLDAKKTDAHPARESAEKLLDWQLDRYVQSEYSGLEVFKLLEIPHNVDAIGSPRLEILEKFIERFNSEKQGQETLLHVLTLALGDEVEFTITIGVAKTIPTDAAKALRLETSLLVKWENEKLYPLTLLNRLKMDQNVMALGCACLETVMKYVSTYNEKHPNYPFRLLEWFTTAYGNTDVALVLARARRADITKTIAATLQTEHFEKLTGDREAFDEVFAGFKLWDDLVDDRGQRVLVLEDYMEFFNERHSMNVTLEAVLRKLLGERNYEAAVKKAASKLRSLIALELSRSLPRQRDE